MSRTVTSSPIFVTGYQRSGTTLLGNLLDRHSRLGIFVESSFIPRYAFEQVLYWPLGRPENSRRLARAIASEPSAIANGLRYRPGAVEAVRTPTYAGLLDALMADWARSRGRARWGDKSPGYITKFHVLDRLFPAARYVHIIRDGRDVWLSLKRLQWATDVVAVARDWQHSLRQARRYAHRSLGNRYLEVRYEQLLERPETVLREVLEFLQERFESTMLVKHEVPSDNPALHGWPKVHGPIDPSNVQKWRTQLPLHEILQFENHAGSLVRSLAYPSAGPLPRALRARLPLEATAASWRQMRMRVNRWVRYGIRGVRRWRATS